MKEDIEMLEKLLKDVKQTSSYDKISHYKALENLLTRYKELEEYYKEQNEVNAKFIPKSKVKEKIEDLEKMLLESMEGKLQKYTPGEIIFLKRYLEQELLEDGD